MPDYPVTQPNIGPTISYRSSRPGKLGLFNASEVTIRFAGWNVCGGGEAVCMPAAVLAGPGLGAWVGSRGIIPAGLV